MTVSSLYNNETVSGRALWPTALLILAVTLLFYIPAIKGGFIWDDRPYVTENDLLLTLDGLWRIWFAGETPQYYPLVFTTFWIERHIFGLNPLGFHTVNVVIHALNAMLVYLALKRLDLKWALAAALIFALHPINVESVAWITERKNVLSCFFYLGAFIAYLKHDEEGEAKWYALSILCFVLALFSKTVASTLPGTLIIIYWMRHGRISARYILKLLPFFIVGAGMGLVTVWWEVVEVGARGAEWSISPPERLLIAGRALWFYAAKVAVPFKHTFIYPRWELNAASFLQWLYPISAVVLGLALYISRARIGRAPAAAIAAFSVALFPALGFFDVYPFRYSFVADHFSYLATVPIIALYTGLIAWGIKKASPSPRALLAVTIIVAALLGALTWNQGYVYKDLETLWRDTIRKNPTAWIAHNNLGVELAATERLEEAVASYRSAIELRPSHEHAHSNLANSLARLGKREEAVGEYSRALLINPTNATAAYNLASLLVELGRRDEAKKRYYQALRARPSYAEAHNNLANLLFSLGEIDGAITHYNETIRLRPGDARAYNNLAIILSASGDNEGALALFKKAVTIEANYSEAYYNMGVTLGDLKRTKEARAAYQKTIEIDPGHAAAYNNLGRILLDLSDMDTALEMFERATELEPENPTFKANATITRGLKEKGQ